MFLKEYADLPRITNENGKMVVDPLAEEMFLREALALLHLSRGQVRDLPTCSDNLDDKPVTRKDLAKCAVERLSTPNYKQRLDTIAMKPSSLVRTYVNASLGKIRNILRSASRQRKQLDIQHVHTSIQDLSPRAKARMEKRHNGLICEFFNMNQEELQKNNVVLPAPGQKIVILAGPFASGKTEIFEQKYNKDDFVVIDLDVIRTMLMKRYDPSNQAHVQKVREESWIISDKLLMTALKLGKSVLIQTALHRKDRWLNDVSLNFAQEKKIPIDIEYIARPFEECLMRNAGRDRLALLQDLYESMKGITTLKAMIEKFSVIRNVKITDFHQLNQDHSVYPSLAFEKLYTILCKLEKDFSGKVQMNPSEKDLPVASD